MNCKCPHDPERHIELAPGELRCLVGGCLCGALILQPKTTSRKSQLASAARAKRATSQWRKYPKHSKQPSAEETDITLRELAEELL